MPSKKLFISYPSESWNFAQRITENLAPRIQQSIFIDYRSIDQADFAASILSHLRESDAVLLVVTEFTFADIHRDNDWVRLEIRTALEYKIPIILVRENGLLPPKDIPDDVRDVGRSQGVPFYREFFEPGVTLLCDFLIKIGVASPPTSSVSAPIIQPTPPPAQPPALEPQRAIGGQGSIEEAMDLLDAGDYEKADFLLRTLDRGVLRDRARSTVEELLAHAETMRQAAQRQHDAEQDYALIAAKAKRKLTEAAAMQEFAAWAEEFADLVETLDSEKLSQRTLPAAPPSPRSSGIGGEGLLPAPFAWVEIPMKGYSIAKYPVTNAQFAKFIEAGGYHESKWWTEAGWKQCEKDRWTEPRYWHDSKWNSAEQPVVGVSWYESVAFCLWLSDATGEKIMLPTEAQWQYAAQSSAGRAYPWGNEWDGSRCNNNVGKKGIGKTTPVRQYEGKGDSPFGVVDMAGNVWEWCLTDYDSQTNDMNSDTTNRVLRGGSWDNYNADYFRCDFRVRDVPHGGYSILGFRLSLS